MENSMLNLNVITAIQKGYYLDNQGNCYSKKGALKPQIKSKDYLGFNFRDNDKTRVVYIHKMQAYLKFGKIAFEKDTVVRHLNGNPKDNSFENIAIGTRSDNALDIPKDKRVQLASHPKHNHEEIIKDYKSGMKYSELMKKYSISSKGTMSFIINSSLKSAA